MTRDHRADQPAHRGGREDPAQGGRVEAQVVGAVEQEHRPHRDHREVAAEPDQCERPQYGVPHHPAQAVPEFAQQVAFGRRLGAGLAGADEQQRDDRHRVRAGVHDQGHRRGERRHQDARESGPGHVGGGGADAHLGPGLDVVLGASHQHRYVRHPAHVEDDGGDADRAGDHQQRGEVECVPPVEQRDEPEQHQPHQVGGQHDGPSPHPVGPDPDQQGEPEVGDELQEAQQPDLCVGCAEGADGGQRQGEVGDLGAEQ